MGLWTAQDSHAEVGMCSLLASELWTFSFLPDGHVPLPLPPDHTGRRKPFRLWFPRSAVPGQPRPVSPYLPTVGMHVLAMDFVAGGATARSGLIPTQNRRSPKVPRDKDQIAIGWARHAVYAGNKFTVQKVK